MKGSLPQLRFFPTLFLFCAIFLTSFSAHAQQFQSSSYTNSDPVIAPGGYSSSASFRLNNVLYQPSIGTSSVTSFQGSAGFLYFPTVTTPVVSGAPGSAQVALSWTAATGFLGWIVGSYSVGQASVSGGPYSYTSLGNTTSHTATGLTNGTTYYFVVRVKDSFSNFIATSSEVSATPVASTPPSGGGGGGGGGGGPLVSTSVNFSGKAYPRSTVTLLKDAQVAATTVAGADANFQISLTNLSSGNYIFSVYSEDKDGRRSSLLSFPVSVTSGATTNVTGIFIAPTISTDKTEVRKGDNIVIFGQSVALGDITISVNSHEEFFIKTKADTNGVYVGNFDTTPLEYGQHTTKSKAAIANEISSFGPAVNFAVGTKNVLAGKTAKCPARADLNNDCKVNLVDFSIAAYWYKRTLSASFGVVEKAELNGDGKITLVDFSIMAYYWTG